MAVDRKETIEQIITILQEGVYKLNDLLGDMEASEDIAQYRRSHFKVVEFERKEGIKKERVKARPSQS